MNQLRASFPERDAYLDRLAQHYADGLLDDAGFEARRDLLLQATTHGEMLRAFDGQPRPRYREGEAPQRRGVGRRFALIGGTTVVGLAALGSVAWLSAAPVHVEEPVASFGPGSYDDTDLLYSSGMEDTFFQLQERGLTLISEFNVTVSEGLSGTVSSPRAPAELRAFQRKPERTLIVAEGIEDGAPPPSVELQRLQDLLYDAVYRIADDLGYPEARPHALRLLFTDRGNPAVDIDAVDVDGTPLGTLRYDLDGNLMAVEENP